MMSYLQQWGEKLKILFGSSSRNVKQSTDLDVIFIQRLWTGESIMVCSKENGSNTVRR